MWIPHPQQNSTLSPHPAFVSGGRGRWVMAEAGSSAIFPLLYPLTWERKKEIYIKITFRTVSERKKKKSWQQQEGFALMSVDWRNRSQTPVGTTSAICAWATGSKVMVQTFPWAKQGPCGKASSEFEKNTPESCAVRTHRLLSSSHDSPSKVQGGDCA